YCSTGVSPRGAQVRTRCGRSLKPLSSTNTMVRRSRWAFFLVPASAPVSNAGSPARRVAWPDRWAVGSSNLKSVESATHGRDETSARFVARSGRPRPKLSTGWGHSPTPRVPLSIRGSIAPIPSLATALYGPLAPPEGAPWLLVSATLGAIG